MYSESRHTSNIEYFTKIINGWNLLGILNIASQKNIFENRV